MQRNSLNDIIKCPISHEPLGADAVIASDGYTYSDSALKEWKRRQRSENKAPSSPVTGVIFTSDTVYPNFTLRSLIEFLSQQQDLSNAQSADQATNHAGNIHLLFTQPTTNSQPLLQNQLVLACESGDLTKVKRLIDEGAKLDTMNSETKFPLGAAIWSLNIDLVKFIFNKLTPNKEYINLCLERNIEIYGSVTPEFKCSNEISLADLCDGYLSKSGRSVVFSPWVIAALDNNLQCWESITLDNGAATANTKKGAHWRFGPSETTVQACTKQDAERSIVWALLLNQITFCIERTGIIKKYLDDKLAASNTSRAAFK
jgi:hypothetical protein